MVGSLLTYADGASLWGSLGTAVGDLIRYGSNDPRELASIGVETSQPDTIDRGAVNRPALLAVIVASGVLSPTSLPGPGPWCRCAIAAPSGPSPSTPGGPWAGSTACGSPRR